MQKDIHPRYHTVTVVRTDDTKFETRTNWGKEGESLVLEIDPLTHPAWTGGKSAVTKTGQVARFQEKYHNISFED